MTQTHNRGPLLDTAGQAALLGVTREQVSRLAGRYGPSGRFPDHPYPTQDPDRAVVIGRRRFAYEADILEWERTRPGKEGRTGRGNRVRPDGLTEAQWRALRQVAAGGDAHPRALRSLVDAGLVRQFRKPPTARLTARARRLVEAAV
jgi:hypothetical protein